MSAIFNPPMTRTVFRILAWFLTVAGLVMIASVFDLHAGFENLMVSVSVLVIGMLLFIITKK